MHGHVQPRIGHITFNAKFLDRRLEVPSDQGIMRRALFLGQRIAMRWMAPTVTAAASSCSDVARP
jgi:hypothetical protein